VLSAAIEGSEFVSIGVADNGPGVRGDIAPKLFQPFETSKPHGMGLGLAISRSIIEARGGRMWLQPVERGSMFCFTLPVVSTAT
jgi:two-component system sensor kinase FixL